MKKSLIIMLTLVFVLVISATAFAAANPFGDVPAKHWSYEAVQQLVNAGIITGYGDGTFRGDKTLTRYEMAAIVANAMSKEDKADQATKAVIEKLAVEYDAELKNLGARVSTLEANSSNVRFFGNDQVRYIYYSKVPAAHAFQNQLVLIGTAKVNEDTTATFQASTLRQVNFGNSGQDKYGNIGTWIVQANGKVNNFLGQNGTSLTVGRFPQQMGATLYGIALAGADGAKVAFGNKLKVELGYANFKNAMTFFGTATAGGVHVDEIPGQLYFDEAMFATANYAVSPTTKLVAEYLKNNSRDYKKATETASTPTKVNLWGIGFSTALGSNFTLKGDYMRNQAYSTNNTATYGNLLYKGADVAKPNTWGVGLGYTKAYPSASFGWNDFNNTIACFNTSNIKGYGAYIDYTLAKNISFKFVQTFDSKDPVTGKAYSLGEWTRAHVIFNF